MSGLVLDRDCSEDTVSRHFAVLTDGVLDSLYSCKAEFKPRNAALKARGIMRNLRWLATLAVLLLCSAASLADSTPPDGKVGMVGGSDPTAITMPSQSFTFTSCSDDPTDCALFPASDGTIQAVFAAINETGYAWNHAELILNFASATTSADDFLSCDGAGLFSITGGGCNAYIPLGTTSLTLMFVQGTGSGISCTDGNYSATNPNLLNDLSCLNNSNAAQALGNIPYEYYTDGPCPENVNPGAVCGPSSFAIGVSSWTDVPTGGTLITPEPSTFQLLGIGAMLAMLALGLKKARIALA